MREGARLWGDGEDKVLRRLWGGTRANDIATEMGRSYWSIKHRAKKIGLPCLVGHRYEPAIGRRRRVSGTGVAANLSISIVFDPETFAEVGRVASKDHLSFSRAALQLIEWGLMEREAV
jgi:hypothetical protein